MAEIGTDIEKAKRLLSAGKVVAVPTDTVYGLAADVSSDAALLEIFRVKNRPQNVPLIALSDTVEKLQSLTHSFSKEEMTLAKQFWAGALTMILAKKPTVSTVLTSGLDTLGIRIPAHPMTLKLLASIDNPLAVTSANIHGMESPKTAQEVEQQLGNKISYILDGGVCELGEASTIIGIDSGKIKLFRQGTISLQQLQQALR